VEGYNNHAPPWWNRYTQQVEGLCPFGRGGSSPLAGMLATGFPRHLTYIEKRDILIIVLRGAGRPGLVAFPAMKRTSYATSPLPAVMACVIAPIR